MQDVSSTSPRRPYTRSPLLIIAYGALVATLLSTLLGTGFIWIVGSAALAVILGIIEFVIRLRRWRAAA